MPPDLICCASSRPLSPFPEPARPTTVALNHHHPLAATADSNLLTLAALPQDHPHALRLPEFRPPSSIASRLAKSRSSGNLLRRSPSFAARLKGQLRRRATIRSLRAEVYDEDARRITSEEVLARVAVADGAVDGMGAAGGAGDGEVVGVVVGTSGGPSKVRLGELSPLHSSPDLRRLGTLSPGGSIHGTRRVRSWFALRGAGEGHRQSEGSADVELRDLAFLNLHLASAGQLDVSAREMSQDSSSQTTAKPSEDAGEVPASKAGGSGDEPTHPVGDSHEELGPEPIASEEESNDFVDTGDENARSDSHASFHLSKKHISQQLRSMSQLSGPTDDSERLTPEAWTFHHREKSHGGGSASNVNSSRSRYMHHTSESGVDSAHAPVSWDRVASGRDSSSSIYSRPTSPEAPEPYEIPADLAAVADWPLKGEGASVPDRWPCQDGTAVPFDHPDSGEGHITIVEPNARIVECHTEATLPIESGQGVRASTPSHKSSSSSTTKRSRFLERFTPPKKLVKKRRSIFKFLRAGSRRLQPRSISTPVLGHVAFRPSVDGPADESELLTVQYDLTGPDNNPPRSVSMNNLLSSPAMEGPQGSVSSPELRRETRPSLAEYERHLSVVGDSRRRPSARDLKRLSQIEEDERHDHIPIKRSMSFHSKMQETDPLMAAALERQLKEKALFRSPSKRSVAFSEGGSSLSFLTTSWNEPSSLLPRSPERDPLDSSNKKPSESHLSPPRTPVGGRPRTSSVNNQRQSGSKKPIYLQTPSSISRDSTASVTFSSLDSWSRYPSHARPDRCASAGTADHVRARDFALDVQIDHDRIRGTDETDPFEPGKKAPAYRSLKRAKNLLPKSRSATFGSFVRYYSNLFSGPDFHGKGRRTSVVVGGKLAHPELEIPQPVLPGSERSQPVAHVHELEQLSPGQSPYGPKQRVGDDSGALKLGQHLQKFPRAATSPIAFRGASVFVPSQHEHDNDDNDAPNQPTTATAYGTESEHLVGPAVPNGLEPDAHLDGTNEHPSPGPGPSRALAWRDSYQDCLIEPPSPATQDAKANAPPMLKPTKRRSPQQQQQRSRLDPDAAIRRFPSVTVVDDRKGHWRSVSFISVRSNASGNSFVRESSNDLLKLMEARERQEREKLFPGVV